jgi:hypothetical protein
MLALNTNTDADNVNDNMEGVEDTVQASALGAYKGRPWLPQLLEGQ